MHKTQHLDLILKAIIFIEKNLQSSISVQNVCEQFAYSSWQFQRLFRAYVGDSIGGYLRARRLTLAAEEIVSYPDRRILDIAIAAQFGSQEAFARAFKSQFGTTPTDIRNQPATLRLNKKPKITAETLNHIQTGVQREPKIVEYGLRHFVGIEATILSPLISNPDCIHIAPKLWVEFNSRRKEIADRIRGLGYGIAVSEEGNMLEDRMTYLASVEVSSLDNVPAGMRSITMKPQRFALFDKVKHSGGLNMSIDYIYGIWLPNSGYKRGEGLDFEIFAPDFNIESPDSVSTYCLPVIEE